MDTKEKKKKVTLVKNPTSFDLCIPEDVEEKIRHLCSKIHDVEWSGTLFYKAEGSLDEGNFKITCLDICVMDIGTSGFTEFKDTEDIIAYRLDHKEKLLRSGVYEGLIHSHNNMSAFFSGTDTDTLLSEGDDMNHFLSLIVCNNGPYVARITRKLKQRIKAEAHIVYTKTSEYDTFENQTILLGTPEISEADKTEERLDYIVEYFEGNIDKAEVPSLFDELDNRIDEIKKSKSKPAKFGGYSDSGFLDYPSLVMTRKAVFTSKPEKENKKTFKTKQLEMFQDTEEESFESIELYRIEEVPLTITRTLCTQLMFGSILADGNANINLKDFAKRMDKVYFKRFGDLSNSTNSIRLENWISSMVETLITYTVDEDYENELMDKYGNMDNDIVNEDSVAQLFADAMIQYMRKLPESDVKDIMIAELLKYMPNDYK